MTTTQHADVVVIGAGIVGMAVARAAAQRGQQVVLFERSERQLGASIRNFGLVWPVGQPAGALYNRALRSRTIWLDMAQRAGIWQREAGSLHLAYAQDELDVLEEYLATTPVAREHGGLLTPPEVTRRSHAVNHDGLRGALWSDSELNVDPREAIRAIPAVLERDFGVTLRFGTLVHGIAAPLVQTVSETWHAERIFVCSGPDFETLYPQEFAASGILRCKLQMLRTVPQPGGWQLGPALCAGLTLLHYSAFAHCTSLAALRARFAATHPFQRAEHIHVLLSQTRFGELTIGDHHEYGLTVEPFDRAEVDDAILAYLYSFAAVPTLQIAERWHGVYPWLKGQTELVLQPAAGVTIVNGLGGAGMTLAFGLAEEIVG